MSLNRIFRAAPLALALAIAAPQAQAVSELSQAKCLEPSAAAEDVADFYEGLPTGEFESNSCSKLCNALEGLCKANSKNRLDCVRDDDKFFFRLNHHLCGDDEECRDANKAEARECREELKLEAVDSRENCRELKALCEETCGEGGLFEFLE